MSLYFEAASLLTNTERKGGSLKSRVFAAKDLKNPPTKVYALLVESLKWSLHLKGVIERSEVLNYERKLTPALAALLTHDLLLAKGGVAAPKNHALRIAIEKHKARLASEFTRCRIREGFGSVEAWREHINGQNGGLTANGAEGSNFRHPRWVRINTLKTSLSEQLKSTFKAYTQRERLEDVLNASPREKIFHIDLHILDLLALPYGHDLSKTEAYLNGEIIFQDKASCFPAYLIEPGSCGGDVIDTCAAPGNKTTHLAALLHSSHSPAQKHGVKGRTDTAKGSRTKVLAFERNAHRSGILRKMVTRAGGGDIIEVHGSTDFLNVRPEDERFADVEALLLDPSCSGTGIVGRDDEVVVHLPDAYMPATNGVSKSGTGKKRKRGGDEGKIDKAVGEVLKVADAEGADDNNENEAVDAEKSLETRLRDLSDFQLKLVQHAMAFPNAKRITYSTCSIHAQENEHVVVRALSSPVARQRGWRILQRREQVEGLRVWAVRGDRKACDEIMAEERSEGVDEVEIIADACIRCEKGSKEGTMGFFVAAFVREVDSTDHGGNQKNGSIAANGHGKAVSASVSEHDLETMADDGVANTDDDAEEWNGFSSSSDDE